MTQTNKISNLTELQVVGGGYLTESFPTNFHHFYRRKVLTPKEKPEDYKEVTEAEKSALEEADAQWQRPPQSFIDQWNECCRISLPDNWLGYAPARIKQVGLYNEETGYFELNGIKDIGYAEALAIHSYWLGKRALGPDGVFCQCDMRTFLPLSAQKFSSSSTYGLFVSSPKLEAVTVKLLSNDIRNLFSQCQKLKKVFGYVYYVGNAACAVGGFTRCLELEDIAIIYLKVSLPIPDSPKLSFFSVDYMITNARNSAAITITVHPDVYAKLTGDTTNAAAAALTEEELAQWMALVDTAAAKNIQFATA